MSKQGRSAGRSSRCQASRSRDVHMCDGGAGPGMQQQQRTHTQQLDLHPLENYMCMVHGAELSGSTAHSMKGLQVQQSSSKPASSRNGRPYPLYSRQGRRQSGGSQGPLTWLVLTTSPTMAHTNAPAGTSAAHRTPQPPPASLGRLKTSSGSAMPLVTCNDTCARHMPGEGRTM